MSKLTFKRRAFIEEYLKCWNGAEAARRAGYAHAEVAASRLLRIVKVQKEIQHRIDEKAMGADEVLLRLAEQARCDYSDYITVEGAVDLEQLKADGKMHLVSGIKETRQGKVIVFHDGQTALLNLGRYHGLFVDKSEVKQTGDIAINITGNIDPDRL